MPGNVSAETAKRDLSVDVARGIAIILVVLGHNRAINGAWPDFVGAIFLFHVPLFFLLSGRVLRPEPPTSAASKLAIRLLVPFALAAVLVGAAKCITRGEDPLATLAGICWATGQTLPWSHLWFLPVLFLALVITQALSLRLGEDSKRWALAVALAAIASAVLPLATGTLGSTGFPAPVGLPWSIDLLPLCLLLVWAGQWLRVSPATRSVVLHPVAVLIAAAAFALTIGTARVDLNLRVFAPFPTALTAALAGCVVTLKIAQWLSLAAPLASPLALIGRHTLVIFILHVSLQKALLGLYPAEPQSGLELGILGLVSAGVSIAITLAISVAIDHVRARRGQRQDSVAASGAR